MLQYNHFELLLKGKPFLQLVQRLKLKHMLFFTPMLPVVMKYITQTAADEKFVEAKQYTETSFYVP